VFVRPGELREAQWHEFDLNDKQPEWRIPAERMKMGEHHVVPLAHQAVEVLRVLYSLTGPEGYVFPSVRNASRPISDNTINAALRRCGFSAAQQTGHGFRTRRARFSTSRGGTRTQSSASSHTCRISSDWDHSISSNWTHLIS
jgi:integrase